MLPINPRRIFLATEPVDMRKSFDTLSQLIESNFGKDPYEGDAFVFVGKRRDRLKVLLWEDSGFWLFCKRLESGTFQTPLKNGIKGLLSLGVTDWHMFLDGVVVLKSRRLSRHKSTA